MYYSPATGPGGIIPGTQSTAQDKSPTGVYIPSQGSYPAHIAAASFPPPPQQMLPNGFATAGPRYAPTGHPQAFAMVSTPAGHPAYAPAIYSSLPYATAANLARIPSTSSQAYISAAHPYPAAIGYQHAPGLAGRSGPPPGPPHFTLPAQAGAPLFAAGYSPLPAGMTAAPPAGARSLPVGSLATPGTYPPAYAFPGAVAAAASTDGTGPPPVAYAAHGGYVPQF